MANPLSNHFPTSHAFLIGIDRYKRLGHLRNAVNDAKGIARVLQEEIHGYTVFPPLLDVGYDQIIQLLEVTIPAQVKEDDRLLFYFAGHGIAIDSEQEGIPEGFILPCDARLNDNSRSISMNRLRASLEKLPCRHVLLILDCCFSGAFRWASLEKRGVGLRSIPKKIYQERFGRYVIDPAWQVLTSSAYDQEALDGVYHKPLGTSRNQGHSDHSPFAHHLMDALRGEADVIPRDQPDGLITATELYMYIRDKLEAETIAVSEDSRQTPGFFYLPRHDKGEYIFLSPKVALNLPHYDPNLNPYKGLQSYEITDKDHFFGRDQVVEDLFEFVCWQSFTIVSGPSGSGKSSIVKAGLIPRLMQDGFLPLVMRPGEEPMKHLELLLPDLTPKPEYNILLLIDQFEELITQCHDVDQRTAFLLALQNLIPRGNERFKLLLTIRSDFEPHFGDSPLGEYWKESRFIVPNFNPLELREIVERPAVERIIVFDPPELVDQIVQEVQNSPGALPLLSFTMSEMYEKLKEEGAFGAFRREDYQALGGVSGALRTRADALYRSLSLENQTIMQKLMLRMVSQEGGELTRRRVSLDELTYRQEAENRRIKDVLNQLTEARLVVQGQDFKGQPYVEPAHDTLVLAWSTLWDWITLIGKDKLLLLNKLHDAVAEYRLTQSRRDLWHNNSRLDTVNEEKERWLNVDEMTFVEKSLALRRRNRNRLIGTLIGVISVLTVLVFIAFTQTKLANQKTAEAELEARANANAALAMRVLPKDPTLALRIAEYANKQYPGNPATAAAFSEIISDPENSFYKISFEDHKSAVKTVAFSLDGRYILTGSGDESYLWDVERKGKIHTFSGHSSDVEAVAFSPDGRYVLTGSMDKTAKLWSVESGVEIRTLSGHQDFVTSVAFSPDGRYILTGSSDKTAKLWSVGNGIEICTFYGHQDIVSSVAFSSDGRFVLTGSWDRTARLWSIDQEAEINAFIGHTNWIDAVVFSPDGNYILTGSRDKTAKLWNVNSNQVIRTFVGHKDFVWAVAFSRDGSYILTGSRDNTAKLWAVNSDLEMQTFKGHSSFVWAVALSPNGRYALTAGADKKALLWPINNRGELHTFSSHTGDVTAVAFSPNGRHILSGSGDREAKLWSINNKLELHSFVGHTDMVWSVAFSPDGHYILTGSGDETAKLWDANNGQEIRSLTGHSGWVFDVAFSPDGRFVLTGSSDETAKLWNIENGQELRTYSGHNAPVSSVAYSPDGRFVLTGSQDGMARLWSAEKGIMLRALIGHDLSVDAVDFSPDGRYLLTGSSDKTARLWNVDNGQEVRVFGGHTGWINDVDFSPDGRYILTGSSDKTAKLWNAESGQEIRTYAGHSASVSSVAYSTDGRFVLTGSEDKTVRLWLSKDAFLEQNVAKKELSVLLEAGLEATEDERRNY